MRPSFLSVLVLVVAALPAPAQDFELTNVANLEALARRVEIEGFGRAELGGLELALPEGLVFDLEATREKELAFRAAWIGAYRTVCDGAVERATGMVAEDLKPRDLEKEPSKRVAAVGKALTTKARTGKEYALALGTFTAILPRYEEVLGLAGERREAAEKVFAARDRAVKLFLDRYDIAPQIARARAVGSTVLHVEMAPIAHERARQEFEGWKLRELMDGSGQQAVVGSRKIYFTDEIKTAEVRDALARLEGEMLIVRYGKIENEQPVDVIRIAVATLLFGRYYFIEREDRIVVVREPGK